jgi:hypothetical protein
LTRSLLEDNQAEESAIVGLMREELTKTEERINMEYRDTGLPAFFVLLPAIVMEDATSPRDIQRLQQKCVIPEGWEDSGLGNLLM